MTRKKKPSADNPEQFKRFIDMAHEVEVDESPGAIDRAFDKIAPSPPSPTPEKKPQICQRSSRK
jgi:hypothetical protein